MNNTMERFLEVYQSRVEESATNPPNSHSKKSKTRCRKKLKPEQEGVRVLDGPYAEEVRALVQLIDQRRREFAPRDITPIVAHRNAVIEIVERLLGVKFTYTPPTLAEIAKWEKKEHQAVKQDGVEKEEGDGPQGTYSF